MDEILVNDFHSSIIFCMIEQLGVNGAALQPQTRDVDG